MAAPGSAPSVMPSAAIMAGDPAGDPSPGVPTFSTISQYHTLESDGVRFSKNSSASL